VHAGNGTKCNSTMLKFSHFILLISSVRGMLVLSQVLIPGSTLLAWNHIHIRTIPFGAVCQLIDRILSPCPRRVQASNAVSSAWAVASWGLPSRSCHQGGSGLGTNKGGVITICCYMQGPDIETENRSECFVCCVVLEEIEEARYTNGSSVSDTSVGIMINPRST